MKKRFINEAFRLQQLAGIIKEDESNGSLDQFLDAVFDTLNDEMKLGYFSERGLMKADAYLEKHGEKLFNSGRSPREVADSIMVRFK